VKWSFIESIVLSWTIKNITTNNVELKLKKLPLIKKKPFSNKKRLGFNFSIGTAIILK
jgi:hypothetical protein